MMSAFLSAPSTHIIITLAILTTVSAWSVEKSFLDWFKNSNLAATLHSQHVSSTQVQHMMKATPLVSAPDSAKIRFATGFWGRLVSDVMAAEQELLGSWKVDKIVEAAGPNFDVDAGHAKLVETVGRAPITLFSFVDCPWCLLAKELLKGEPYNFRDGDGTLQVLELEDLGWEGKGLRASIALATGRTSMPACFVYGKSIGGYTDGFGSMKDNDGGSDSAKFVPDSSQDLRLLGANGLKAMHESGGLYQCLFANQRT